MNHTHPLTALAVLSVLSLVTVSRGEVVYQSDFTGADLASAGLTNRSSLPAMWVLHTKQERLQVKLHRMNDRASVLTSDSWQSDGGFTLDVTFTQVAAGNRFSIGIVDADWDVSIRGWLNESLRGAYGIGFVSDGELESAGTIDSESTLDDFDVLAFNNGSSSSVLSAAQGDITFNTPQTLSITVTDTSYSYSLNGAPATTGSLSFDTSRNFRFIAHAAKNSMRGSYISNITLTAVSSVKTGKRVSIPEPTSFALLGGLLALSAVMLRRRR